MPARFHVFVGESGLLQTEDPVYDWTDFFRFDQRPDIGNDTANNARFFRRGTISQRGSEE